MSEHTCTNELILGTNNPQELLHFFMFLICIFLNINEYGKIYENNGKTTHNSEVMETYCTHYLPSLYIMGTNMSVRFYKLKKTNVTTA